MMGSPHSESRARDSPNAPPDPAEANAGVTESIPIEPDTSPQRSASRLVRLLTGTPRKHGRSRSPPHAPLQLRPSKRMPVAQSAFSKELRQAALRERGLLPPLPSKDLSQLEREQDRVLSVVKLMNEGDADMLVDNLGLTAADLIKQEWESRNRQGGSDDTVRRDRFKAFEFGGEHDAVTTAGLLESHFGGHEMQRGGHRHSLSQPNLRVTGSLKDRRRSLSLQNQALPRTPTVGTVPPLPPPLSPILGYSPPTLQMQLEPCIYDPRLEPKTISTSTSTSRSGPVSLKSKSSFESGTSEHEPNAKSPPILWGHMPSGLEFPLTMEPASPSEIPPPPTQKPVDNSNAPPASQTDESISTTPSQQDSSHKRHSSSSTSLESASPTITTPDSSGGGGIGNARPKTGGGQKEKENVVIGDGENEVKSNTVILENLIENKLCALGFVDEIGVIVGEKVKEHSAGDSEEESVLKDVLPPPIPPRNPRREQEREKEKQDDAHSPSLLAPDQELSTPPISSQPTPLDSSSATPMGAPITRRKTINPFKRNQQVNGAPKRTMASQFSTIGRSVVGSVLRPSRHNSEVIKGGIIGGSLFVQGGRHAPPPSPTKTQTQVQSPPGSPSQRHHWPKNAGVGVQQQSSPVLRQAVSPTLHSTGSILAEASNIEDEEQRRMAEMMFLS
ncbi:hypothetical protein FA15DRAFT_89190 [Coprinopsis marcescibilis]|uniref:Uncharacterized protein n=1 Tax=Coprinopsis marcescibilis TaxID=230819 RepID=A0A5C3L7V8_COPMA|nr:hypothetical protein FA15DRAFT_89190 [Coprinopsis marcescibilis]